MRRWIARGALTALALGLIALLFWQWQRANPDTARDASVANAVVEPASAKGSPSANARSASRPNATPDDGAPVQQSPADARCGQDRQAQYRLMRARLDPTASPSDAVAHIQLGRLLAGPLLDFSEAWKETEQALARWPDDVELAWLAIQTCDDRAGCKNTDVLAHLRQADSQNLYAWLPAVADAYERKDADAFQRMLMRAAEAPITDSRMGTVYLRMRPVLGSVPMPPSCTNAPDMRKMAAGIARPVVDTALIADMEAVAMDVATAMPGLFGLQGCSKRERPKFDSAAGNCRRVLARLAQEDSLMEQGLALPMLIELAEDDASRAAWRERYRHFLWLRTLAYDDARSGSILWRMWTAGEIPALEQHARDTGRWPPPADWLPEDESSRELLGKTSR